MVERFNKTIEHHLSKVVDQHQKYWDQLIPLFLMANRAAVHNSTEQPPSNVLFGRELRLPCDVVFGSPKEQNTNIENYVDEWQKRLLNIHGLVREILNLASDKMKARYDLRANSGGFQQNDKLWLFNPQRKKCKSPKLTPVWKGPYNVVKRLNDVVYRVQRSPKGKM